MGVRSISSTITAQTQARVAYLCVCVFCRALHSNQLYGTIPQSIANITSLEKLYLYANRLTGSIPTSVGNMTNLSTLYGDWYRYSVVQRARERERERERESCVILTKQPAAMDRGLGFNQLSGTLPDSITNLAKLEWLYVPAACATWSIKH
jgi:Leucine-rich repeat (LRR) protein